MKAKDYLEKLRGYDFDDPDHFSLILGDLHDLQLEWIKQLGDPAAAEHLYNLTSFPFLVDVKTLKNQIG